MKIKHLFGACLTSILALGALTGCGGDSEYDSSGRLILRLKNVYFDTWVGADTYTEVINDKFNVKITPSNYDYNSWDEMVYTAINGDNLTDVIQFNLKAYNFGSSYEKWVRDEMIKPLPDDMSRWPNLQKMIGKVSHVDALKINNKLYGIPVLNDLNNPNKDFSNFTYIYRRDIAKNFSSYREGDVYTWNEFLNLVKDFRDYADTQGSKYYPLADESWGFPSVTNFFKKSPHVYAKDSNGRAINSFTSKEYEDGLEVAREFVEKLYYSPDQFNYVENKATETYTAGFAYILYDNMNLSNYIKFRQNFKKSNKNVNLDDGTAFLKVKDPNGQFALESTENWFSMTMFNNEISTEKMEKILDIMEYLLTEEGTRLAIYGIEGYDYTIEGGKVVLSEQGWEKGSDGKYGTKENGAKYLRYMATLGGDTKSYDPYTEMDAYNIIDAWTKEMATAKSNNQLRVVQEPADISWMSTANKKKTEGILSDANTYAMGYAFGTISTIADYEAKFNELTYLQTILDEINAKLGVQLWAKLKRVYYYLY